MGLFSGIRAIIIIVCLLATACSINLIRVHVVQQRDATLADAVLPSMNIWLNQRKVPLSEDIVTALELDDYLNIFFTNGKETISLYVGYYLSQKKVGVAHSPLVCFAGQGWEMSDFDNFSLRVDNESINLTSMKITKNGEKQLVLYWFQAFDKTSPGTFMQKVNLLQSKLFHSREDNAFVRVIIPYGVDKSLLEAKNVGTQFIEQFYPIFKNYIMFDEGAISHLENAKGLN